MNESAYLLIQINKDPEIHNSVDRSFIDLAGLQISHLAEIAQDSHRLVLCASLAQVAIPAKT